MRRFFLNFLQTLKSVLRLLIDREGLVFSFEELQESRIVWQMLQELLHWIEHDLTDSDINVTGIPTVSLQLPIRN